MLQVNDAPGSSAETKFTFSVSLSVCLCACLPVYVPTCLPLCVSVCLPAYLAACLSLRQYLGSQCSVNILLPVDIAELFHSEGPNPRRMTLQPWDTHRETRKHSKGVFLKLVCVCV